jgi:hypothetical protein
VDNDYGNNLLNAINMNKNEIVARFMGVPDSAVPYDESYDWLIPAWVKFRGLQKTGMPEQYYWYLKSIEKAILYGTITEAFDELVKGIEWVNSLKK